MLKKNKICMSSMSICRGESKRHSANEDGKAVHVFETPLIKQKYQTCWDKQQVGTLRPK